MILEVNEAGEILIPAELVGAAPHVRLEAERKGDSLVLKPIDEQPEGKRRNVLDLLPVVEGRMVHADLTFRREDLYGSDAR